MVEKIDKMTIEDDLFDEKETNLLKKVIIWSIVVGISLMLLLTIIFQPRFFTFVP